MSSEKLPDAVPSCYLCLNQAGAAAHHWVKHRFADLAVPKYQVPRYLRHPIASEIPFVRRPITAFPERPHGRVLELEVFWLNPFDLALVHRALLFLQGGLQKLLHRFQFFCQ